MQPEIVVGGFAIGLMLGLAHMGGAGLTAPFPILAGMHPAPAAGSGLARDVILGDRLSPKAPERALHPTLAGMRAGAGIRPA